MQQSVHELSQTSHRTGGTDGERAAMEELLQQMQVLISQAAESMASRPMAGPQVNRHHRATSTPPNGNAPSRDQYHGIVPADGPQLRHRSAFPRPGAPAAVAGLEAKAEVEAELHHAALDDAFDHDTKSQQPPKKVNLVRPRVGSTSPCLGISG